MERYQYMPLPRDHSKIRLVRLQPRSASDSISVEIFHAQLSSHPKYEALSYAWGHPDKTRVVYVRKPVHRLAKTLSHFKSKKYPTDPEGASTLGIAENLFIALQHLRYSLKSRVLWIDAICIDQNDPEERSAEVLRMGSIYKNACQVIVWLGPNSPNSGLALQTLKRIGEAVKFREKERIIVYKPGGWPATLRDDIEALKSHTDCWFAIKDLLTREWFSRLWVVQEIVLAQKASIVIGEIRLDWQISVLGLRWIRMMSTRLGQHFEALDIENLVDGALSWFMDLGCSPTTLNLFSALESTGNLLCSDPRDRLFAIRSLLHPADAAMIVPNYSLGVEEVYTCFAKEWLVKWGDVKFLSYCILTHAKPPTGVGLHLPSWVPDWSYASTGIDGLAPTRCTGESGAVSTLVEKDSLDVQGILVGDLAFVDSPAIALVTDAELRELCCSWMQQVSTSDLSKGRNSVDNSFMEMIMGGKISEKRPSTQGNHPSLDQVKGFWPAGMLMAIIMFETSCHPSFGVLFAVDHFSR